MRAHEVGAIEEGAAQEECLHFWECEGPMERERKRLAMVAGRIVRFVRPICLSTTRINPLFPFYARASDTSTQNNHISLTACQRAPRILLSRILKHKAQLLLLLHRAPDI
jgi:hypothetical protein